MSGQRRSIVLQAIGVAVIAAIIFTVFLRPDEPDGLSGIEAEGGEEQSVADPKPDKEPKKKGPKNSDGNDQGRSGPNEPRRPGLGDVRGAGIDGADDDIPLGEGDDDAPPADQYDDLVTRLMKQVGEPRLYREIDPAP